MSKLAVAVVGAGYWGPKLVRNFAHCETTRARWVVDLDVARAAAVAEWYPGLQATASLSQALADDDVEAVAVATPVASHYAIVRQALEAGRHVLVEKPLALTVREGSELVELAEARGLRLMVDHTFCYTGAVRKIGELIAAGELGELLYFDSVRVNLGLFQSDVNVLWDLAPHDLSIMDFVLPPELRPVAVSAHGVDAMGTGYASVAYLALTFDRPVIGHLHANWLSPVKVRKVLVGGTRKMIVWDDTNPAELVKVYDKGVDVGQDDKAAVLVAYRHGAATAPVIDHTEPLLLMVREFAAAIREDRQPLTDGQAGLRVLRVLEAADRSLARGGESVPLDPARG